MNGLKDGSERRLNKTNEWNWKTKLFMDRLKKNSKAVEKEQKRD